MKFFLLPLLLLLASCAAIEPAAPIPGKPAAEKPALTPVSFDALPGWRADDPGKAVPALQKSCARIVKAESGQAFASFPQSGSYADWQRVCDALKNLNGSGANDARAFFENNFQAYAVTAGGTADGLFTGYYEASLKGSRTRTAKYNIPLYARPADLVMVDLGNFRPELKGQRIAGRVADGNLKPYEDRAAIVGGKWPHNDQALVYVDDAVDAFFVQIQGSGIVELAEGGTMRIGYAGQNGHPYTAIGKELIARGALTKENVSMQSIAAWLRVHPGEADSIMNLNKSYVFFTEGNDGAKGAEGVVLTPERSLAVDHGIWPYGMPVWLDAQAPAGNGRLQQLMVAQDTGGAIIGPVRGDVFWGYGDRAESLAGPMKSPGRMWILLPRR